MVTSDTASDTPFSALSFPGARIHKAAIGQMDPTLHQSWAIGAPVHRRMEHAAAKPKPV